MSVFPCVSGGVRRDGVCRCRESEKKDSLDGKIGLVEVKALASRLVSAKKCRSRFPVVRCGERADGEPRNPPAELGTCISNIMHDNLTCSSCRGNYSPSSLDIHTCLPIQYCYRLIPTAVSNHQNKPKTSNPTPPASRVRNKQWLSLRLGLTNPCPWLFS
jgi:hypothetical protein